MIAWLLTALVGVVFLFAGVQKLMSWSAWRIDARAQGVPPHVVAVVPLIEVVLGVALIVLQPTAVVLGFALTVLVSFTVHLVVRVRRGDEVPCGCFGSTRRVPPSWRDVWRNCVLMACLLLSLAG
jgi:uncharacterized membrane protein YphA (DoxX/SURF4 family)